MSGPKTGVISIIDPEALAEARKRRKAEKARKAALEAYNREKDRFDKAVAERTGFQKRFSGIKLPDLDDLQEPNKSNADSIKKATASMVQNLDSYLSKINKALMNYHQKKAGERAAEEMLAWSLKFKAPTLRTTKDVISALEPDAIFAVKGQQKVRLEAMANYARGLVESLPEMPGHQLSENTINALEQVLLAEDESDSKAATTHLNKALELEQIEIDNLHQAAEQRRRLETMRKANELNQDVAAELVDALGDLGYNVTDIESTAYTEDGQLYAAHDDWPEHLLRFELDPKTEKVKSVPLRVHNPDIKSGAADLAKEKESDTEFDTHWCNSGVINLKKKVKDNGVGLKFRAEALPGQISLEKVDEQQLGEDVKKLRSKLSKGSRTPKYRTHK